MYMYILYCIARKFGGLADCLSNRQIKICHNFLLAYNLYIWRSCTEPLNLNPLIRFRWQFVTQLPNLIPTNISGYMVCPIWSFMLTFSCSPQAWVCWTPCLPRWRSQGLPCGCSLATPIQYPPCRTTSYTSRWIIISREETLQIC